MKNLWETALPSSVTQSWASEPRESLEERERAQADGLLVIREAILQDKSEMGESGGRERDGEHVEECGRGRRRWRRKRGRKRKGEVLRYAVDC